MAIKYSEFMQEITKEELLEGLLGYGMFAEKIPPIFTSIPLYNFCIKNGYDWINNNGIHSSISYESMRNISVPRILSIPHPVSYVNHCECLSENWYKLQLYFEKETQNQLFKVSRVHIRKMKDKKSLFEMNYKNGSKDGYPDLDISIGNKYVVKADIANCFPSIYSHAIPWALVGIQESKNNQRDQSKWYNEIDFRTHALKDNETHGILIGPHASNLISEIILTKIDNELCREGFRYTRTVDDYTCFVDTQQNAEQFLIKLSSFLKTYGLLINHKKTEIIKLPVASTEPWIVKLNSIPFPDRIGIRELKIYLNTAIDLSGQAENIAVLNYAIKALANKELSQNAISYYLKTIHHLVIIFPYLLPVLEDYVFIPFKVDSLQIKKIARDILLDGIKFKRYEQLSYAIYYALKYDFKFGSKSFIKIVNLCEDCIFMVLSYIYDRRHNEDFIDDYIDIAKNLQNDDLSKDKYWLYIYEILKGIDLIEPSFKALKKGKVSFLKFK